MDRPNIVLIFPDHWRGDCLGVAGHPAVETPFLDQLAAVGTWFANAYTPSPSCIPARACLATGLTPNRTGRLGYQDFVPWQYPGTFMKILRDSGYQTLCSGKTHFYPQRLRLGFEELALYEMPWQDWDHPSDYHVWLRKETRGLIRDTGEELDSNSWIVHPWTHPEHLHPNTWTTTAAIEMLERRDVTRPFFLQVGYHRPHPPYDPPLSYFERFAAKPLPALPIGDWATVHDRPIRSIDASSGRLPSELLDRARRAYYAQIAHLDFQIGRLWQYLKGRGLLANTWIIFSSDHGEMLGDHNLFRKICPFEGSAKIPLIIAPPRSLALPRGTIARQPVTLTDLMPTILEMAACDRPKEVESRSLLGLLTGSAGAPDNEFVHGEHAPAWQFVTDGRAKYIWNSESGEEWFFDLRSDHHECRNLAATPAMQETVAFWRGRLVEILAPRVEDRLTDGKRLVPGRRLPAVRPFLMPPAGGREPGNAGDQPQADA